MKITADSNVLIRAVVRDDAGQADIATAALREADIVVLTLTGLSEFVWVLSRSYRISGREIASALRSLISDPRAVVDSPAVQAGLASLDAGGDFADGVIAYDGRRLGGEVFLTFDRDAAALTSAKGGMVRLLQS